MAGLPGCSSNYAVGRTAKDDRYEKLGELEDDIREIRVLLDDEGERA